MPSPSEPTELRYSVGKFVYGRGGSTLLHFMPLYEYHLEEGMNVSMVVSLRTARQSKGKFALGSLELSQWMDITQVETIGAIATALLPSGAAHASVVEIDAGIGTVFEGIKAALAKQDGAATLDYTAVAPPRLWEKFEMLHRHDDTATRLAASWDRQSADLTILNHAQGIRQHEGSSCEPEAFVADLAGCGVLAARVADAPDAGVRTTIDGREVKVPSLPRLLQACAASGGWSYRYLARHDTGYFLPGDAPPVGLLLAYRGAPSRTFARFEAV